MNSNDAECRRAFYRFLEDLRLEVFSMYEGLREVRVAPDEDMEARLQRLSEVGAAASHVHSQVEQLFAAVWFDMEQPETNARPSIPLSILRREPVAVA